MCMRFYFKVYYILLVLILDGKIFFCNIDIGVIEEFVLGI